MRRESQKEVCGGVDCRVVVVVVSRSDKIEIQIQTRHINIRSTI